MDLPEVTKVGLLDMQVCVPKHFTDKEVEDFANNENPSGLANGWGIRRQGSESLAGCDERVQCSMHPDKVHIMLNC